MTRLSVLVVLTVGMVAQAPGQTPPAGPKINLTGSGSGTGNGQGTASVSGSIECPAPWQLSIHVLTIRYQKNGGSKTLNAFVPVKDNKFFLNLNVKTGTYTIWAVIDVKDAAGREKQISSDPQTVTIQ